MKWKKVEGGDERIRRRGRGIGRRYGGRVGSVRQRERGGGSKDREILYRIGRGE